MRERGGRGRGSGYNASYSLWIGKVESILSCICTVPIDPISATVNRTGRPVAGSEFTLSCIIEAIPGFTNMPSAVWMNYDYFGAAIVTGGDITVQTTPGNRVNVTTLTFNPVKASDDGEYVCRGGLMTPAQPNAPLQVSIREIMQVQSE